MALLAAATIALVCRTAEDGAAALAAGAPPPPAQEISPTQVVYEFVKDSGGGHPGPTSSILLGFAQGGEAYIYAFSAKHSLAYHGRWSYASGQMALSFNASDFKCDVHFPLRLSDEQVSMAFQVMSKDKGQSTWQKTSLPIESGIFAVYRAARADDSLNVSGSAAARKALDYARSRVQLEAQSDAGSAPRSRGLLAWASRLGANLFPVAYAYAPCQSGYPREVKDVDLEGDVVIHIQFCSGPDEWIYLGYICPFCPLSTGSDLHITALTTDPRVHLDPQPPGDASSDPESKTALIIAPFTDPPLGPAADGYQDVRAGTRSVVDQADLSKEEKALSKQDYSVTTLINEEATVQNIVAKLSSLHNPGILDWEGHGVPVDVLITFDHSKPIPGKVLRGQHPALVAWYTDYLDQLTSAGLGGLVTYDQPPAGSKYKSATLGLTVTDVNGNPNLVRGFISLDPPFWEWMAKNKGLDLSRSLALMNACDSAKNTDLAQALKARAFFGWNYESGSSMDIAVQKYLLESLARPTHSAEESYYNMLRVAKTRAMIYKEDRLLNGNIDRPGLPKDAWDLMQNLRAYGWDGSKLIDYSKAGWAGGGPKMNAGQVWWLLFAERWSHDPSTGSANITGCYDRVWSGGQLGNAFKEMFCHNANTGQVPTRNEAAYAVYLLTGKDKLGFSGTKVPRWTLNDGR